MDEAVGRVTIVTKYKDNLSCCAEWKTSVDVAVGDTVEVRGLRSVVRSRDDYGASGIWFDLPVNARVKRGDEVRVYPADTALEARKPQVPAEVIERAREALNALLDPMMVLRKRHVCALNALLAAAEAAPAPTPFASMSADNLSLVEVQALRDWLDERGRRDGYETLSGRWYVLVRERTNGNVIAYADGHPTEPSALLALCQKIAAEEASC